MTAVLTPRRLSFASNAATSPTRYLTSISLLWLTLLASRYGHMSGEAGAAPARQPPRHAVLGTGQSMRRVHGLAVPRALGHGRRYSFVSRSTMSSSSVGSVGS